MARMTVWPWLRPFVILILVVCVPPTVYWFGYVQSSVGATRQRAYGTLSAVTADFRDRLIAYDQIAANAGSTDPATLASYVNSILKVKLKSGPLPVSTNHAHLDVGSDNGGLNLYIPTADAKGRIRTDEVMQAVVPLENLVPWDVVETEFDGLLVLDERGLLLAQDRRLPAQPLSIRVPLMTHGAAAQVRAILAEPRAAPGRSGREKSPIETAPKADAAKVGGSADPSPVVSGADAALIKSSIFDFPDEGSVQVAGVDYVAFLQAVSAPVTPLDKTSPERHSIRVLVCGLIARDRLRHEAIQLSPQVLVIAATLAAIGLFAIPFLKLRFIGARERMRQRDVWLLAMSTLCFTALISLVILEVHDVEKLQNRFDTGLRSFALELKRRLEEESAGVTQQLRSSARALLESAPLTEPIAVPPDSTAPQLPFCTRASEPAGAILATRSFQSYLDFEALIETDLCGNQIRKWMPRTLPTPNINIADQPYFAQALALTPQSLAPGAGDYTFGVTLAPTTGLLLGVYAMPVDGRTRRIGPLVAQSERTGIVANATTLQSVGAPIIARPFQFALIDRHGAVEFQRMRGSYRGERLYEAIAGGHALAAAAAAPQPSPSTYQYRGQSYRMIALDVPELRSTLIAAYDCSEVTRLAAQVFGTAVVGALGLIAALLLGAATAQALWCGCAFEWAWPSRQHTSYYLLGSATCALLMLLLFLSRLMLPAQWLRWLMLAFPFVCVLLLGSRVPTIAARRVLSRVSAPLHHMAFAYRLFAVVLLLAFVALPSWIVFTDASDLYASVYESEVTQDWRAAAASWDDANRDAVVDLGEAPVPLNCERMPEPRCTAPERIYALGRNYRALGAEREQLALDPVCAGIREDGEQCRSDSPDTPAVPYSLTASVAAMLAPLSSDAPQRLLALRRIADKQAQATAPRLWPGYQRSPLLVVSPVLLLVALFLLVRSISTHVLGINLTDARPADESGELGEANGTTWILLRPSQMRLKRLESAAAVLDLRRIDKPDYFPRPGADATLLVEHIESKLDQPNWRAALLAMLTDAAAGRVILTSEIDPLYFLTERVREQRECLGAVPADDKDKRTEALRRLDELCAELSAWAVAMRLTRKLREVGTPAFGSRPERLPEDIYRKLTRECSPAEPLAEIGQRLLARVDLHEFSWDEIVELILDAAEPYYRSLWELCSSEERLVLIQLAQAGLANPRRVEVIRRLSRRDLLKVEPRFRLMNESFERFVCRAEPQERIAAWERTDSRAAWSRLGTPLYALGAMVVAVLLFAEQGAVAQVLAIATGSVATLGSLRTLYVTIIKPAAGAKLA